MSEDLYKRLQVSARQYVKRLLTPLLKQGLTVTELAELVEDLLPAIANHVGQIAVDAATDWYEQTRQAGLDDDDYSPPVGRVAGQAGAIHLPGDLEGLDAEALVRLVCEQAGTWARQAARNRVRHLIKTDPSPRVRWARVPTGAVTCAWCKMLASRGFAYTSKDAAGAAGQFHRHCDCRIVPAFGDDIPHIPGYDPDRLYEHYKTARGKAEDEAQALAARGRAAGVLGNWRVDDRDIAYWWRRLYPGEVTDPVRGGPRKTRSDKGKKRGPQARRRFEQAIEQTYARASDARIRQAVARMSYLRSDLTGLVHASGELEVLKLHELDTIERLESRGELLKWVPVSDIGKATNDFRWLSRDDSFWELKSTKANYSTIAQRISEAVEKARKHDVVKDRFIIDIGLRRLSSKLRRQLTQYNQRRSAQTIRELVVLSQNGAAMETIELI